MQLLPAHHNMLFSPSLPMLTVSVHLVLPAARLPNQRQLLSQSTHSKQLRLTSFFKKPAGADLADKTATADSPCIPKRFESLHVHLSGVAHTSDNLDGSAHTIASSCVSQAQQFQYWQ